MKNIFILPTENSSRLSYNKDGVLELHRLQWRKGTQYVYITSDEEIKEGDWFYDNDGELCKYTSDYTVDPNTWKNNKKIILTTDQDLIKDGVRAIDDEFLEWLVKNPSCEWVGVEKDCCNQCDERLCEIKDLGREETKYNIFYKIIIPKEETKQELPQFGTKEFNDLASTYFGGKPKQEIIASEEDAKILIDAMIKHPEPNEKLKKAFREYGKQETLEEAAENAYRFEADSNFPDEREHSEFVRIFKRGAKWQQEQDKNKFSEEEVKHLIKEAVYKKQNAWKIGELDEWFEQFKKK